MKEEEKDQATGEEQSPKSEKKGISTREVDRYLRYVVFLVLIGLVYIWNSHWAESMVRQEEKLNKELAAAKANYRTIHARLSSGTLKHVIKEKVAPMGLKPLSKPPLKIVKRNE